MGSGGTERRTLAASLLCSSSAWQLGVLGRSGLKRGHQGQRRPKPSGSPRVSVVFCILSCQMQNSTCPGHLDTTPAHTVEYCRDVLGH